VPRKARKAIVGKAEGAETVNLNTEELARGRKADEEDARKKYLEGISDDASFIASTMKGFADLCKTAEESATARDEYFSQKMKVPAFADRVQRVRDWASTKRNNEVLTIDGKEYKSVKVFFKKELGKTYEYIRQLGKKLGRVQFLLDEGQGSQQQGTAAQSKPSTQPAAQKTTATAQPEVEILAVHGIDPLSFTMAERVQSAFQSVLSCAADLSCADRGEFFERLISRLLNESEEKI
jgi:hypothetical protein